MVDPYREWLGVNDDRRPPTLYQLLGISPLEADARSIDAAVARQLARVQQHLTGPQSKLAWQLVDEITLAKTTLLDPAKRAAYNSIFGFAPSVPPPAAPPSAPAPLNNNWWADSVPDPAPAPTPVQAPVNPDASTGSWYAPPPSPPPAVRGQPDPWYASPAPPPAVSPPPAPKATFQAVPPAPRVTPPAVPPAPVANVFVDSEHEEPGALPEARSLRRLKGGGNSAILFMGGGILALGLIGGGIFLAMQGGTPATDSKNDAAGNNTAPKVLSPKETSTEPPKKVIPLTKKILPPKIFPKNDLPPTVPIDEDFKQAKIFRGHKATPRGLAIAADGRQVLSAAADFVVNSWFPGTDNPVRRKTLSGPEPPVGIAFLNNGKDAVIADSGALFIIDLATNADRRKIMTPGGSFTSLFPAADGQHFVTGSTDSIIRWWEAGKDTPDKSIEFSPGNPVECVTVNRDGKLIAAGNLNDGMVGVWTTAGAEIKKWKAHTSNVTSLAISSDGKRLVTAGDDLLVKVWDLVSGAPQLTLKGHEEAPLAVGFSDDGSLIISGGIDKSIRFWDAVTGDPVRTIKVEDRVGAITIDPKGKFLVAGTNDGGVNLLFLPAVRPDLPPKPAWVKAPKTPMPVPSNAAIEAAIKSVRDRYANDFAQTEADDQAALLDKLLMRAKVAPEEANVRLALFLLARDQAVKLGRIADAFKVVDARSLWFEADELEDKAAALKVAAGGTISKEVVEASIGVVEEAEKQVRLDIVDELFRLNELFPQSDDMPELTARIAAARKRWSGAAADREASRTLATEWSKMPDDPKVNEAYGQYLCFRLGEWADGLPKLVKVDSAALRQLAKQELADNKDPKAIVELGKAWFDYAGKAEDQHKAGILVHAKQLLDKAIPMLPATERLPAGQKLTELNKAIKGLGAITLATPGEPVTRKSFNSIRTGTAVESNWIFVNSEGNAPDDIVLKANASATSRFKMLDKSRVEFNFVPDGRTLKLNLYGLEHEVKTEVDTMPVSLSAERKGDEIIIALKSGVGSIISEKYLKFMPAKQVPTILVLHAPGPGEIKLRGILVNGQVKMTE